MATVAIADADGACFALVPRRTGRSAHCLTIRLTPDIVALLQSNPKTPVSICLRDGVLTVGEQQHRLNAFSEDSNVCAVCCPVCRHSND